MLLKPAYQITTADSGRAALEMLSKIRPDVVILDIKMPEMDGLEVLRRVKRADPTIEVVMITAYASLETVKLALTHGAFEYLIKPFSRQDLEDVVHRALVRRQADLGARGQVARLVEEMRKLSAKTRELEEAEATEQSLRVTPLSILREISRTIVGHLDPRNVTAAVPGPHPEQPISSAGEAISSVAPDDRIEKWNPAAERIFGYGAAQAIGRPITDMRPRGDYADARRRLAEGPSRSEFQTTATAGQPRPVELAVTLSALHGRHGRLEGLIAIVRDIT